jgi:hypothetical protein
MLPKRAYFGPVDAVLLTLLIAAVGWGCYAAVTRLDYVWDWSVIGRAFLRTDAEDNLVPAILLEGLLATLRLGI